MDTHAEIGQRKQRWRDFLARKESCKRLFTLTVPPDAIPDPAPPAPVPLWPEFKKERIEVSWRHYQRMLAAMEWLKDDAIPSLNVGTGTEIFAEALGCRVHRDPTTLPFALPLIGSASEVSGIKVPELSSSSLAYLFDMADELHRRGVPEALLGIVDLQSPMDIAALVWDKNTLFLAMIDTPEAVKELAAKACELLCAFLDEWFRRYGTTFKAHCPGCFMEGGLSLSVDEVGAVSSEMFETFFLPELDYLSRRYGGLAMHCCANSQHQWKHFARIPDLRILNLHRPPEIIDQSFIAFKGVTTFCPCWEYFYGTPEELFARTPPEAHVLYSMNHQNVARSREHALELVDIFRS
jgi:hypothetical protein